jgi:phospho-N-acetylmuramoyl-pentapeptide-transferase
MFQEIISYLILGTIISTLLSVPIINLLYRLKIVRQIGVDFSTIIEDRKTKYGTPIMGGLIVIIPVLLITLLFNRSPATIIAMLIFVAAALLGGLDDVLNIFGKQRKVRNINRILKLIRVHKSKRERLKYIILFPWLAFERFMHMFESNPGTGLRAHEKLLVQLLLGAFLGVYVYQNMGGFIWMPFFGGIDIGWLIIPFAILMLGLITNAVNITDGMDGLAAGIMLNALGGFMVITYMSLKIELTLLSGTIIGALITYLYFNIAPARVQFGDIGSFSMGAILTVIAFLSGKVVLLFILALPFLIEIGSTIIQSLSRRLFGRRIFMMAPIHHHFEMLGWKEEKVVMRFWLYSIITAIIGVWLSFF